MHGLRHVYHALAPSAICAEAPIGGEQLLHNFKDLSKQLLFGFWRRKQQLEPPTWAVTVFDISIVKLTWRRPWSLFADIFLNLIRLAAPEKSVVQGGLRGAQGPTLCQGREGPGWLCGGPAIHPPEC
ncbi:unnamed protein product [Ostreobium quekettii]|uniref:Uncharacterized protein n=1 Tax=Ostreobium quekettii TaxID=121088 RepID=A0A8S1ITF5_9CHLO|nr:unnamed protein product [Ostreobium quekettii]